MKAWFFKEFLRGLSGAVKGSRGSTIKESSTIKPVLTGFCVGTVQVPRGTLECVKKLREPNEGSWFNHEPAKEERLFFDNQLFISIQFQSGDEFLSTFL